MRTGTGTSGLSREQRRLLHEIRAKGQPMTAYRPNVDEPGLWCEQSALHDGTASGRASVSRSLRRLEGRGLIERAYYGYGPRCVYVRARSLARNITVSAVPLEEPC